MWTYQVDRAHCDQFCWRDATGSVRFAGQRPTSGRHRDRVWPALSRYKRVRTKKREWRTSHRAERFSRALNAASLLTVLRHWYPCHPLEAWHIRQCDRAQRPPRYDP